MAEELGLHSLTGSCENGKESFLDKWVGMNFIQKESKQQSKQVSICVFEQLPNVSSEE